MEVVQQIVVDEDGVDCGTRSCDMVLVTCVGGPSAAAAGMVLSMPRNQGKRMERFPWSHGSVTTWKYFLMLSSPDAGGRGKESNHD